MSVRGIYRGKTPVGNATASNAPIYVDSDDNLLKVIPAGTGSTEQVIETGTGRQVTPTAAVTLTAAQSGATILLNAAAGFEITLPALAAGLRYRFQVGAAFATTNFTIVSASSTNIIEGGAIVNSVYVPAVNEDTISFVATAETVGDYVDVECDGAKWLTSGVGALAGSITFTVAS